MKKSFWITLIAGVAAVAAAAIAIAALIRRKTDAIAQELDFEPDDDYFDLENEEEEAGTEDAETEEEAETDGDACDECVYSCGPEDDEEITIPAHEVPLDVPGVDEETEKE